MTKLFVLALILSTAPFAAFADPMSIGGDGNLLASANVAAPASSAGDGGGMPMIDPADAAEDDASHDPLVAPEPAAPRQSRQQPDTAHAPGHAPAHAANPAHKKTEPPRWQSLLPGVMK